VALTQGVKSGLIACVFLWFTSILVTSYFSKNKDVSLNVKKTIKYSLLGVGFISILILSMLLRIGEIDFQIFESIFMKFTNYACGHLAAFDVWFNSNLNLNNTSHTYGLETFYGISNSLGLAERVQGIFTNLTVYGYDKYGSEMGTNVFTVFRFFIDDFGILGSLIFISFLGTLSGFIFSLIKKNNNSFLSIVILASFIFFIFYSFATSAWAYTSYIVVFFVFYVLLRLSYVHKPNNKTNIV